MHRLTPIAALVFGLTLSAGASSAWAQTARERFETALARESGVRTLLESTEPGTAAQRADTLRQVTRVIAAYEGVVRRYPTNGYADNALWQGAALADAAYRVHGRKEDRATATRLYTWLVREYPHSPLIRKARTQIAALDQAATVEATLTAAAAPVPPATAAEPPQPAPVVMPTISAAPSPAPTMGAASRAMLTDIQRSVLPDAVRITLAFDREVSYHEERITGPDRVFFDLRSTRLAPPLTDAVLSYPDDIVRQIRTGRRPDDTARVVLDLNGVARYSVFTLYNPFRVVIDCERATAVKVAQPTTTRPARVAVDASSDASAASAAAGAPPPTAAPTAAPTASAVFNRPEVASPAALATPAMADTPAAPAAPLSNGVGGFSLSRQLGLSVSRIVIDPGHGGHDPGARGHGIEEAALTLDVALRLEQLLLVQPGIEVVLTRRSDVYVPLEERTAIANREAADLFLSIHANASRNTAAHGVETYYLSFAGSADAEAVAARENSASERAMHNLPDIIKAIALNNKLDESRDLASMVQESMITRLRRTKKDVRNLGVKKAPFVVLIGAGMPSVLAEISFLTNRPEANLLKTPAYKQRIAEALHDAVMKYRKSLKRQTTIADRP